jgi:ketosteroid isomerase-like protein
MKTLLLLAAAAFMALMFTACGAPASNSAANTSNSVKPANSNANYAAPAADNAATESEIKKLVSDYVASTAKNDAAAYDKATTDNFMFVSDDGTVQTKADRLASMRSGQTKYETLTYDDVNVRVNAEGNGAVVIGKATVKGLNMGRPLDATVRVTQVWSKTKDGWKMASLQATDIKASTEDKKSAAPPANK